MSSNGSPRARIKPPAEAPPPGIQADDAIRYLETLKEILDLAEKIDQWIVGDDCIPHTLRKTSDLSRWIWAEVESLPLATARSMALPVEVYKSILQTILTNLERNTMDLKVANTLSARIDRCLDEFQLRFTQAGIAMAQSSRHVAEAQGGSSFFQNAHHFRIIGSTFVSHSQDITGLQETCAKILRAVHCLIVLFY
ncbi:hypothetical protein GALMADRAFT_1074294 [Galerina marginata CBS 339.88]|uniref:Uncharacterized protein n=1 Tax=Galerina marginata (strain CBS 339.88) TaxID=685588 RepID=A0A067SIZ8_GALM3|nr:hypothetical protein GALMADRAFT_1074294 [Galerina marginata CBS 339.88]